MTIERANESVIAVESDDGFGAIRKVMLSMFPLVIWRGTHIVRCRGHWPEMVKLDEGKQFLQVEKSMLKYIKRSQVSNKNKMN